MSQPLTWSDAFAVGHAGLDREHRALVDVINLVCNDADASLSETLGKLKVIATRHFDHENALIRAILACAGAHSEDAKRLATLGLDTLTHHIDEHGDRMDELDALIARSLSQGSPAREDLQHWFYGHAIKADAHLKTLFQFIRTDCPDLLAQLG